MSITGKQVSAGVEIMKIVLATKPRGRSQVSDILDNAYSVASVLTNDAGDMEILHKAIVERMITIKAEVS